MRTLRRPRFDLAADERCCTEQAKEDNFILVTEDNGPVSFANSISFFDAI